MLKACDSQAERAMKAELQSLKWKWWDHTPLSKPLGAAAVPLYKPALPFPLVAGYTSERPENPGMTRCICSLARRLRILEEQRLGRLFPAHLLMLSNIVKNGQTWPNSRNGEWSSL